MTSTLAATDKLLSGSYYFIKFHDGSYALFNDLKEYQNYCDRTDMSKIDYVDVNEYHAPGKTASCEP